MQHELIHLKDHFPFLGKNGADPTLTVYVPKFYSQTEMLSRAECRRPGILLCPGGAYRFVADREGEPVAMHLLSEGYCVFILTYSVAPHRFPTQLLEVAAALELIHANSAEWKCDPGRIAIMGFSAGGHLSAHYSNAYDCPEVRAVFPDSKPVQASVLCYPVISSDPRVTHIESIENVSGRSLAEEDLPAFSCDKLVSAKTPPTYLWSTTEDELVPIMNTVLYAQTLAQHGVPMEVHIYAHGPHGMATVDSETCDNLTPEVARAHQWLDNVKVWLNETL